MLDFAVLKVIGNTTVKNLLLTLILSSLTTSTLAGWDDVYYCEPTSGRKIYINGEMTDYQLKRFKFKIDKEKNALVVSEYDGLLSNTQIGINVMALKKSDHIEVKNKKGREERIKFKGTVVLGRDDNHHFSLLGNYFYYNFDASVLGHGWVVTAECDKF